MIAKIKFDGKEHMAIVLDESHDISTVFELKHALNAFMQTLYSQVDDNQIIQSDAYSLHTLLGEMELSESQAFNMLGLYFGKGRFNTSQETAKKKPCEIYI